ncbi:MAG: zinc-ribbon domain-containing protein [Desulfobacterales bacterium]|nr:zinc-ribbon domain-containing protein [Desulfobacterales bacterium]
MFITCQECNTTFRLDERLLKSTGSKVRCSQCRYTDGIGSGQGARFRGACRGSAGARGQRGTRRSKLGRHRFG